MECPGNPVGVKAWEQVAVQGVGFTEVRGQIPVVPTVVTAKRNFVLTGRGPGNAHGDRADFAATSGVSHHVCPRVKFNELLREIHLFGCVQG